MGQCKFDLVLIGREILRRKEIKRDLRLLNFCMQQIMGVV
jgi:hypothetical protein